MSTTQQVKIKLENVRLSFPSLFQPSVFEGNSSGKYEATFLLSKDDKKTKAKIDKTIQALIAEAKIKVAADKIAIKDGDDSSYDGYGDHWSIKASNKARPLTLNSDKSQLTEQDGKLYSGCYVNAIIGFWVQNNKYGKRVNANLYGVQFVKDGEPFGAAMIDVTNDFDDIGSNPFGDEDEDEL